jgi:hypothetical protein
MTFLLLLFKFELAKQYINLETGSRSALSTKHKPKYTDERYKVARVPSYTTDPGIAEQSKSTRLYYRKIIQVCLNTTSGGEMTLQVTAIESETDKGFHPESWHGEKNHNNVLHRNAASTVVAPKRGTFIQ